jgi:uncharacterized protein YecE (DUF72 family)
MSVQDQPFPLITKAYRSKVHVGMSGWVFPEWRRRFYPKGLPQRRELEFASHQLRTIEINGTFYSLQTVESYQRWYQQTPDDFIFSLKGPKFITQSLKLANAEGALANFFASGVLALGKKLGPVLWQLPPSVKYDPKLLTDFFKLLPTDTAQAIKLAKKTDAHFKRVPFLKAAKKMKIRHAIEVRNQSFKDNEKAFLALLRKFNVAIVITDSAEGWPYFDQPTADFIYARLQGGSIKGHTSRYTPLQLKNWAKLVKKWQGSSIQLPAFIYIDKHAKPFAPVDAMTLQKWTG